MTVLSKEFVSIFTLYICLICPSQKLMNVLSIHHFVSRLTHAIMYLVDTSVCVGLTMNWLEMSVVSVVVSIVYYLHAGKP